MDRKQKQVERYLRQAKHFRTPEERKEIERQARERKASRRSRRSRRRGKRADGNAAEQDETLDLERMAATRSPAVRPPGAVGQPVQPVRADLRGLVVGLAPRQARVRTGDGVHDAALAAALADSQQSAVAVGDEVELERRSDGSLRAVAVAPRRSVLSRPDPGRAHRERVLAANVDIGVLVVAAKEPRFRARLIDRVLVALQRGAVAPLICVSKVDLLTTQERGAIEQQLSVYRDLEIPCVLVSNVSGEGVEELRSLVRGNTCVLVGQSGVGKSSMLNSLEPSLALRTSRVREGDGKGRHTTTGSSLLELSAGTRLIDTPGVRAFGLFELPPSELPAYFPEFEPFAGSCRFSDCSHVHEPHCAVRAAREGGELSSARYEVYLRIRTSLEA